MCQPGAARAPGAGPGRLSGFAALPQDEVQGVFLVRVHLDAGARPHVIQVLAGELAVAGKAAYPEIDVGGPPVGETPLFQAADQVDDLGQVLRGSGLHWGRG